MRANQPSPRSRGKVARRTRGGLPVSWSGRGPSSPWGAILTSEDRALDELIPFDLPSSTVLGVLTLVSLLLVVTSLLLIPWSVARLPEDYLTARQLKVGERLRAGGPRVIAVFVGRNLLASVLVLAGVLMLFVPGQGLLTIVVGVAVADFPGRRRLVRALLRRRLLARAVQKLRVKAGVSPLRGLPPPTEPPPG